MNSSHIDVSAIRGEAARMTLAGFRRANVGGAASRLATPKISKAGIGRATTSKISKVFGGGTR